MWRLLFLFACLFGVRGENLHLINSIPFGASSLKIVFSHDIQSLALNPVKISNDSVYIDINAVLDNGRKVYFFPRKAQVTIAQNTPKVTRIVITNGNGMEYQIKQVQKNIYLSFVDKIPESTKLTKKSNKTANDKTSSNTKPSIKQEPKQETESSTKSDSKKKQKPKKGYKVVIDAGHGGRDCGTLGVTKVCEKHIVLKVAQHLNRELKKRGYITYMTRDKDVYLNLRERTEFANAKSADLFVSIHANSVPKNAKKSPKGVETYFLSTARSDRARDIAEQENKDDIEIMNYFSKQTFLNSLNSHRLLASNKLAIDIQYAILKHLRQNYQGVIDGGVREGPFWVLAGALMPSVLIEIGYNSNPIEAPRLNDDAYQKALAIGIADGIDGFVIKNF